MTGSDMNPPSYDKVVLDSNEPLVLRPPVGSAVYHDSKFSLNPIFSQYRSRSRRSGLVYVFVFLLILLAIAGVLMILFLFGLGPLTFAYKQDRFHQHHQSICRIRIPFLKIEPIESVSADENSLNVSISSLPTYNMIRILHSFEDRLTVIRTNEHCYIRPIRADLISDSVVDYVKRLNEGTDLQQSVNGRVFTEPWFVDQSPPSQLYSSLVMAWCTGVPVYRLVSQPPAGGYQIDNAPAQETDVDTTFHDSFEPDDDDDAYNLVNGARVKFDKPDTRHSRPINMDPMVLDDSKDLPMPGGGRFRRSFDLAAAMGVKPDQLPSYTQNRGSKTHCIVVDDILEDAPIPSQHQSNQVRIVRDVILKCKSH